MTDLDSARLGEAVDLLYEAAAGPELWPSALDALSAAAGGIGALMAHKPHETAGWFECSPLLTPSLLDFFAEGWATKNARTLRGAPAIRAGHHVISETLLFEPGELDRQPIQAEFFNRYDLRSFIGFEFVPNQILASVERGRHEPADWEISAFRRILPHLKRVGALALARGAAQAHGALDALSLVNCPAILLDNGGRIVRMNEGAELLLPSAFQVAKGALIPLHPAARGAFRTLVAVVTAPERSHQLPASGPVTIPREAARPLIVRAAPIVGAGRDLFRRAKAILMLADPDRNTKVDSEALRRIFGMTQAEARVAQRLVRGESLEEISNAYNVSKTTARTHLREIFSKTQTRRQAELAALLNRIA